ncbi:hypothetical protein [Denitratisoma oestradiolicum]|uniref:hypothetical protein n=1 Tax=Denitratisoma oestradiolicum TaxID=311182 RepID=UPI001604ECEC|nr:hypothetical protein [Denitratisoma oestradiolicum]
MTSAPAPPLLAADGELATRQTLAGQAVEAVSPWPKALRRPGRIRHPGYRPGRRLAAPLLGGLGSV